MSDNIATVFENAYSLSISVYCLLVVFEPFHTTLVWQMLHLEV